MRNKESEVRVKYKNKLQEALEIGNTETCNADSAIRCAVEKSWRAIKNAIIDAGKDVLGTRFR